MYLGYLKYNGIEIVNSARTYSYLNSLALGSINEPDQSLIDYLQNKWDSKYTSPLLDGAPWVSDKDIRSHNFYGVILLEATGIDDNLMTAQITENAIDNGAYLESYRKQSRQMQFNCIIAGKDKDACEYGKSWLSQILNIEYNTLTSNYPELEFLSGKPISCSKFSPYSSPRKTIINIPANTSKIVYADKTEDKVGLQILQDKLRQSVGNVLQLTEYVNGIKEFQTGKVIPYRVNLIRNSSFAKNLDAWGLQGNVSYKNEIGANGYTGFCRITGITGISSRLTQDWDNLIKGGTYQFSIYIRNIPPNPNYLLLRLFSYTTDEAGEIVERDVLNEEANVNVYWGQSYYQIQIPYDNLHLQIIASGTYDIDDILLEPSDIYINDYFSSQGDRGLSYMLANHASGLPNRTNPKEQNKFYYGLDPNQSEYRISAYNDGLSLIMWNGTLGTEYCENKNITVELTNYSGEVNLDINEFNANRYLPQSLDENKKLKRLAINCVPTTSVILNETMRIEPICIQKIQFTITALLPQIISENIKQPLVEFKFKGKDVIDKKVTNKDNCYYPVNLNVYDPDYVPTRPPAIANPFTPPTPVPSTWKGIFYVIPKDLFNDQISDYISITVSSLSDKLQRNLRLRLYKTDVALTPQSSPQTIKDAIDSCTYFWECGILYIPLNSQGKYPQYYSSNNYLTINSAYQKQVLETDAYRKGIEQLNPTPPPPFIGFTDKGSRFTDVSNLLVNDFYNFANIDYPLLSQGQVTYVIGLDFDRGITVGSDTDIFTVGAKLYTRHR